MRRGEGGGGGGRWGWIYLFTGRPVRLSCSRPMPYIPLIHCTMLCPVPSTTLGLNIKIRRWWSKRVQNGAGHITLCLLHHFPLIIVLRKGEHKQVIMFFLPLFLTVFGTLAAEFEVLVFACQNGEIKTQICVAKISFAIFQVTSKYVYDVGNHKKKGSNMLVWEGKESAVGPLCSSELIQDSALVINYEGSRVSALFRIGNKCTLL